MDRVSRRHLLRGLSLVLVSGSGCVTLGIDDSGAPFDSDGQEIASPTATERQFSHSEDAPESRTVRNTEGDPAVRSSEHSPERDVTSSGDRESSPSWDFERWIVTSTSERAALDFPRATTGVDAATDFIADTDLSEETLLVHQYRIEECMIVELDHVQWDEIDAGPDESFKIRLDYDDVERDTACEHDSEHGSEYDDEDDTPTDVEATLIRIPATIEEINSLEYGW